MANNSLSKIKSYSAKELLAKDFEVRRTVIDPWLRTQETGVVWAPTGVGKTMLCLSMALMVAGGGTVADWSTPEPLKVVYIDGEMNQQDIRDRIVSLIETGAVKLAKPEVALENLTIIARQAQDVGMSFYDVTREETQVEILKMAKKHGAGLFILDNLTTLSDGLEDENDAAQFKRVQDFFLQMKRAGIATILVHHANKGNKAMRGSTALEATFEVILGLKKPMISSPSQASFVTEFSKFRNRGDSRLEPRAWTLGDDGWTVKESTTEDPKDDSVYRALKSLEFISQDEIASQLCLHKGTVSKRIKRLKSLGTITEQEVKDCFEKAKELRVMDATGEDDYSILRPYDPSIDEPF